MLLDSDFWSIVNGSRLQLSSLGTKQATWQYRHGQAKVNILICVKDSTLQYVFQAKTSKEVWNTL
jgi:hypothetical protein